jgi:hypothetical protein
MMNLNIPKACDVEGGRFLQLLKGPKGSHTYKKTSFPIHSSEVGIMSLLSGRDIHGYMSRGITP